MASSITLLSAAAHGQCRPAADSNEGRLLGYYEAPLAFSPQATPGNPYRRRWSVSGDITYIPPPDRSLQRTSMCFAPKNESTQLASIFPRPRVAVDLPYGASVEASYLPPVRVGDAEPDLFSGALSLAREMGSGLGEPVVATVRAHLTRGSVRGAITCARSAVQLRDPALPCYGTAPSRDTFHPNASGIEGIVSHAFLDRRIGVYGGVGHSWLQPRFQVGFRDAFGYLDSTRVEVDLTRLTLFAGAEWRLRESWSATAQLYSVPKDVTLFRLGLTAGIGAYRTPAGRGTAPTARAAATVARTAASSARR